MDAKEIFTKKMDRCGIKGQPCAFAIGSQCAKADKDFSDMTKCPPNRRPRRRKPEQLDWVGKTPRP